MDRKIAQWIETNFVRQVEGMPDSCQTIEYKMRHNSITPFPTQPGIVASLKRPAFSISILITLTITAASPFIV